MKTEFFNGSERFVDFPILGRRIRAGSPEALKVSDRELVQKYLQQEKVEEAKELLSIIHSNMGIMMTTYTEWVFQHAETFSTHFDTKKEREITLAAFDLWKKETTSLQSDSHSFQKISNILSPETMKPGAASKHRETLTQTKTPEHSGKLLEELEKLYSDIQNEINAGNYKSASVRLDPYYQKGQLFHDLLVQYTSSYPAVVYEQLGQSTAEKFIQKTFSECSFHGPIFQVCTSLPPQELAAFLAEHLRAHLSGENRDGSTEVIEEADRYRLLFKPCGSGGALRRRNDSQLLKFSEASPATWGRKNEVPPYCTHCAFNEIHSTNLVGYPTFVTEFNPDPQKPCGWTVYKDPNDIPEEVFTRIGKKKRSFKLPHLSE